MPIGIYKHKRGYKRPPISEKWRDNLIKSHLGQKAWNKGLKGYMAGNKHYGFGKHRSEETKRKISLNRKGKMSGKNHPMWKGGITTYERLLWFAKRRRAMRLKAEGTHTQNEWLLLKASYDYMCLCCKRREPEIKLTEDHIIPLSKGGSDYIENIQPLCKSCNSVKHTRVKNYKENYKLNILQT